MPKRPEGAKLLQMGPYLRDWIHKNYKTGIINAEASDDAFSDVLYEMLADGDATAEQLAPIIARDKGKTGNDTASDEAAEDESIKRQVEATIKQFGLDDISRILRPAEGNREMSDTERDNPRHALFASTKALGSDGAATGDHIRVKRGIEMYSITKEVGKHSKLGTPMRNPFTKKMVELPSQAETAACGAWIKHSMHRAGMGVVLSDHERDLVQDLVDKSPWTGFINGEFQRDIRPTEVKALLDDGTSGGQELSPTWFDDSIIQFPVLFGELFPLVTVREAPRASSVETASIANPTITSGPADGSAMTPFSTTSLVADISATIFNATVSMEIGRDFLADAAVDVGEEIFATVGSKVQEYLDNQIANGDVTTEPEGIFNASGTTTISFENGTTGSVTLNDLSGLIFGIGKEYRANRRDSRIVFISNDTSYKRARDIAVSGSDQRRVLGLGYEEYRVLERDWRIQNDVSNALHAFGNMHSYRMWRRGGVSVRIETGGNYLGLRNLGLLIARMRIGGKVVDANAFAVAVNGQA